MIINIIINGIFVTYIENMYILMNKQHIIICNCIYWKLTNNNTFEKYNRLHAISQYTHAYNHAYTYNHIDRCIQFHIHTHVQK